MEQFVSLKETANKDGVVTHQPFNGQNGWVDWEADHREKFAMSNEVNGDLPHPKISFASYLLEDAPTSVSSFFDQRREPQHGNNVD